MKEIITAEKNEIDITSLYPQYVAYIDASPKTVATYERALRQFVKYIRDNSIANPRREDVIAYRDSLMEDHKATTVANYLAAVRLFFQWTAQEGLYPNVADRVKSPKLSKEHKKDPLSARQIKTILAGFDQNTVQGRRDYALFALMVTCGLRDVEVHRANIEDLRTVGEDTLLFLQGKGRTEKADFVRVPEEVEAALRATLKDRKASGSDPLFASMSNNSKGERMSIRSISGTIKKALVSNGYNSDRLTAHSLRHSSVTLALNSGQTIEEAREFARHSNIATTLIYAHHLNRLQNGCSRSVASAIF